MSQQPIRKLNKRLIYWSLMGLAVLTLPAIISLASFGKKEARGEQNHREVHSNLLVHDTETISGTEGFPDTYGEIKSFEREFVKSREKESIAIAAPDSIDAVIEEENLRQETQPRPHYSASSYSNRNDDPWNEEKMREQKQRAADHYDSRRSDIMFVNNVQNRKSGDVKSEEDQLMKMMDQAIAMQERAQPNEKDTLLLNSKEQANQSNSGFFRRGKNGDVGTITNPSKFMISEGTLISAILLSEINTDLPGPILARVSHTIRDSRTGQTVLIPQNSMLIGEYNSTVGDGQTRAQIMWTRVIFPNQQSVNLGAMVGVDKKATSGAPGSVDNHYDKVAVALLMTTTLGAGVRMVHGKYDRNNSTVAEDFGNSLAQETARIGSRVADKMLSIKPTITVPMGERLNVFVEQDLHLEPYPG